MLEQFEQVQSVRDHDQDVYFVRKELVRKI